MLIGATIGEMPCKVILNLRFSEGRLIHMLLKAHRHHKAGPWGRWLLQAFHHSWKRPEKPHHIRSASQHFWAPFILFPRFLPVFKYHFYHLYLHHLYMKIHLTNTPLIWLYIIFLTRRYFPWRQCFGCLYVFPVFLTATGVVGTYMTCSDVCWMPKNTRPGL